MDTPICDIRVSLDMYTMARRLLHAGKLGGAVEQLKVANALNRQLLEQVKERTKVRRQKKRGGA